MEYFNKMRGEAKAPLRDPSRHVIASACGGFISIALIAGLTTAVKQPLLMAPFGATCVLAFGVPVSPLAQPRNIIGGHLISTLIGLIVLNTVGTSWMAMALATAASIAMMQITRTVHPPAGADPLVVILTGASWRFMAAPVLAGSLVLVLCALLFNNLVPERRYPKYWF